MTSFFKSVSVPFIYIVIPKSLVTNKNHASLQKHMTLSTLFSFCELQASLWAVGVCGVSACTETAASRQLDLHLQGMKEEPCTKKHVTRVHRIFAQ